MSEAGSGTLSGWCVEARCADEEPRKCNGIMLGQKWTRLHFDDAPIGVPKGSGWEQPWLSLTGRLSYEAAQALRWWWLAELRRRSVVGHLCIETRLARDEITYEYKTERKGEGHVENEESLRWVHTLGDAE